MKRLDNTTLPAIIERLGCLTADSERQFGTLTPVRMLEHVRRAIEFSLGRIEPTTRRTLGMRVSSTLMWPMVTSGMPWPKGKVKTAPEFEATTPGELDEERDQLQRVLADFIAACEADPRTRGTVHPFFGPLRMKQWARLHFLHIHHHLQQFGV